MPEYVDPRHSDRAVGVELRILELSERIRRVRRHPSATPLLAGLEAERRRLYDELARAADAATPTGTGGRPAVRARRVN